MRREQLIIRAFEPEDGPAVWDLHNKALEESGAHAGNGPWDDDLRDPVSSYLAAGGEFLVGLLGAELVAMGAIRPTSPGSAEIKRMRVSPPHQRKGLGTRILLELERRAGACGFMQLRLDTTAQQKAAQRFYERHGYAEVERRTLGRFEVIFYEKRLPTGASGARERGGGRCAP